MAKTKTLMSFAVTTKLICVFVFAYAKSRFSHDKAHIKRNKYCNINGPDEPKPEYTIGADLRHSIGQYRVI